MITGDKEKRITDSYLRSFRPRELMARRLKLRRLAFKVSILECYRGRRVDVVLEALERRRLELDGI
jgi:hypothetical protein